MTASHEYRIRITQTGEERMIQAENVLDVSAKIKTDPELHAWVDGRGLRVDRIKDHDVHKEDTMNGKFIIAGTGTRQLINEDKEYRHKVLNYLQDLLTQAKAKHGDNLVVVSGMAEGFDEALARAAVAVGVPFVAAVPNPSYMNYYWTRSVTGKSRLKHGTDLLAKASEVVYVCKTHTSTLPKYNGRAGSANFQRNEWMVDRANVMWAFHPVDDAGNVLPLTSGTKHCVNYAKQQGVKVFKIVVNKDLNKEVQ